jgi:hypothetical protein
MAHHKGAPLVSMGGHQSSAPKSVVWLTPPPILAALGGWQSFDLDPCAAPFPQPWRSARRMNTHADANGLQIEWDGRVWLNPPYTSGEIGRWLERMAAHDDGTALIFARTETDAFHRYVWERASGLLFLRGRLSFHRPDGSIGDNAGAPSVLCAYGRDDMDRLAAADLDGNFVPLRLARFVLISGLPAVQDQTWREAMRGWIMQQRGPVSVSEAYRHFARHPKAARNPNWQAKVRQVLAAVAERVDRGQYRLALA